MSLVIEILKEILNPKFNPALTAAEIQFKFEKLIEAIQIERPGNQWETLIISIKENFQNQIDTKNNYEEQISLLNQCAQMVNEYYKIYYFNS